MVGVEPGREGAVVSPQDEDPAGVLDGGVYLQAIAHDPRVGEQASALARAVMSDDLGIEGVESPAERLAFAQDRQPGETGLVDLQTEPLEERGVLPDREPVFAVVVRAVIRMSGSDVAVGETHAAILGEEKAAPGGAAFWAVGEAYAAFFFFGASLFLAAPLDSTSVAVIL